MNEQQKKELAERQVRLKEEALLFQGLFNKGDGKAVFKILKRFTSHDIVLVPTDGMGRTDPYAIVRNEGKRSVTVFIEAMLNKTFNQPKQTEAKVKE